MQRKGAFVSHHAPGWEFTTPNSPQNGPKRVEGSRSLNNFRLFGLDGSRQFAQRVARYLDVPLSRHIEKYFSDKEPYVRSDENVRGCDVYVISSLYSGQEQSVGEKFHEDTALPRLPARRLCPANYACDPLSAVCQAGSQDGKPGPDQH